MDKLTFAKIQEFLNHCKMDHLPKLKISILRNIVIEPIAQYLKYLAYQMGYCAEVKFGDYDNIFKEAFESEKGLLDENNDCVFVFNKLDTFSQNLSRGFNCLSAEEIKEEVERNKQFIKGVLGGIRRQTNAMVLWHGYETPAYPALGIYDSQALDGQMAVINEINGFLRLALKNEKNSYFVDLSLCLIRLGYKHFYDLRYWHLGRAPYSRQALQEIAIEDFKFIRALKGKSKKCLVLDCDNTLWGGIIGEDGLSGIKLSKSHPGSGYYEFQQEIVNLYNQGIIIALCSKNNEDDVWEVFRKHPDMVLKEEHIATSQINWGDKPANLKQIAFDLNIGLDSMVFIDDSEFEVNLVREVLPEVEVINLPNNKSVEYKDILASCGLFDILIISKEDKKRGSMYRSEILRKRLKVQATDLLSFYKSMEMVLDICLADAFSIPRIAQLTQKTNQFNLTTRRYSEDDIKGFINSGSDVIYIRLRDRFGDSGIVGVCILKYKNKTAIFDTFLLSCRVLGRGVEDAFLVQALKLSKIRGCKEGIGMYIATRKNTQVKNFYGSQGFKSISDDGNAQRLVYDLTSITKKEPEFFSKINWIDSLNHQLC